MRYVKISHMGVSSVAPLDDVLSELREMYVTALPTDLIEVSFVEMSEEDFEKLHEFQGY
jgi:hypothetical protein